MEEAVYLWFALCWLYCCVSIMNIA